MEKLKKTGRIPTDTQPASALERVDQTLRAAIRCGATDIHFEWPGRQPRIRFRIDGVLQEQPGDLPPDVYQGMIDRVKAMARMNVEEKMKPQDGRALMNIRGQDIDLRISVSRCVSGESAVARILNRQAGPPALEKVIPDAAHRETIKRWIHRPNGLVIATGPTGSGKTTLLYGLIQELNTPQVNILTVEDPVEYILEGVNQQQLNWAAGNTFARLLRSCLRQDPDIVVAGEVRDLETIQLLVQTVLTGHLVMTTLHTQDAPEAIRRLLDIGVDPFMVNSTLTGIVAQRLVRCICPHCKESYTPPASVKAAIGDYPVASFARGKGCAHCFKTGYRGRAAIHELIEPDDTLRDLVTRDAGLTELRRQARKSGVASLKADGFARVNQGLTTVEEVLSVCAGLE